MAKSTTFQTTSNTSVIIGTEATMGTASPHDTGVTLEMPITEFSFSETNLHSLSQAPLRVGTGGINLSDDMVKWQKHDRMFEISITFHASNLAIDRICHNLFEDSTTPNALLGTMPLTTDFRDGQSNTIPVTLWFENAGHDGEGVDMYFTSCMCTSFSLSGDIASNGGVVMGTATFVTGYAPVEAAFTLESTSGTNTLITSHTSVFNMHDLQTTTLDGEDMLLYSFDFSIERPVNRIGFDPDNSYRPYGYSVGQYEVTGSLTCKRDGEVDDAINNSGAMALDLDTTVFQITGAKVYVDNAGINFDDDGWKQTIPLVFTYDSAATSNPVITIGTAA